MTTCDHISDRMPAVASGRTQWSADDERHLADCEACRLEWDVVHGTARLGTAPELRLDEAAIADAVLRRLRTAGQVEPHAPSRRRARAFAGTAGAVAVAASLVLLVRGNVEPTRPPASAAGRESTVAAAPAETGQLELSVPELEDVPAEALDAVLQALERPLRADEWLESNWSEVESREFESGFSAIRTSGG
jgi:hypothetical protein